MAKEKRLIDANYLIRDINADIYRTESEKSYDRCLVYRQPTVDAVEVVHGRWLISIDNECEMHKCSVCGARVVKGLYEYENPNKYCYHCGAKMDGDMENNRQAEVIR